MTGKTKRDPAGVTFKRIEFEAKGIGDVKDGVAEIDAYASWFGNIDSHGDIVHAGAFDRTLKEWAAKESPIPAHYNHALFSTDPLDNIGYLRVAVEDEKGLKVTLVLDVADNPKAAAVYRLAKAGRLKELSIGYITKTSDWSEVDGVEVRNVRDVDLLEVSIVQIASNDLATVTEIRSALLYGKQNDDSKADDEDDDEPPADDDAKALTADELTAVIKSGMEAMEAAGVAISEALATMGAAIQKDSDDEDADATDSEDADADVADAKSRENIQRRTRALLAFTASHGAEGV